MNMNSDRQHAVDVSMDAKLFLMPVVEGSCLLVCGSACLFCRPSCCNIINRVLPGM
jgi:hypothetical protein